MKLSKTQKLLYILVFLWITFGILTIINNVNLTHMAGYFTSLTLFISTYLWGEHRRPSKSTNVLEKGPSSSREIIIYVVLLLWTILGLLGVYMLDDINSLSVYFGSLSPFIMSYIIYKSSKGKEEVYIYDEKTSKLVRDTSEDIKYEVI